MSKTDTAKCLGLWYYAPDWLSDTGIIQTIEVENKDDLE